MKAATVLYAHGTVCLRTERGSERQPSFRIEACQPGLLCQNLLMPTPPILKPDNLGRQIGDTTIKLDTSHSQTHTHTHTVAHKSLRRAFG